MSEWTPEDERKAAIAVAQNDLGIAYHAIRRLSDTLERLACSLDEIEQAPAQQ